MQVRFAQLAGQLSRGFAPIYLICGDEPYQLGEAARLVRQRALTEGYEREVLDQDAGFDWAALAAAADSLSLFSQRKLIELRVSTAKLGKDGAAALRRYGARPCPDNLLLMVAPALDRTELKAQWAKELDALGVVVQVWPLRERELEQWLAQRLRAIGLEPEPGVAALLAERAEGNLMAAAQEVEKIGLLHESGPLRLDDLIGAVADSARFDLFALTDAALAGDRARVQRVLSVLRGEGIADVLVLWVIARELRMLTEAAGAKAGRASPAQVLAAHRVPRSRFDQIARALNRLPLPFLRELLRRCAVIDRAIKGLAAGDPWHGLTVVADALAAGPGVPGLDGRA